MANSVEISERYQGPSDLRGDAELALQVLANLVSVDQFECSSHSVLQVRGLDGPEALEATAVYLVAAVACSIDLNLEIRKALFSEETLSRDLSDDVVEVVGSENLNEDRKTMVRNPWIWEGISHMLLHLSTHEAQFHPTGTVIAKTLVKHDIHDHGLDIIAVYDSGKLGITAGECKAYFSDPTKAVADASDMLREVDGELRNQDIRTAVTHMRTALDESQRAKVAAAFWKEERTYLPFVCCDVEHELKWDRNRLVLQRLRVPVSRKILIPLALSGAREQFDLIANTMRAYAAIQD